MQTPAILTGNYTRPDDLVPFEYEVILEHVAGERLAWKARITSIGAVRGRRDGVLENIDGMSDTALELAVRDVIESAIRDRIGTL